VGEINAARPGLHIPFPTSPVRSARVSLKFHIIITPPSPSPSPSPSLFSATPLSEAKHVLLFGWFCFRLGPLAEGQALFSIDVLRIYPNVQDLGVSSRLSEPGGEHGGNTEVTKRPLFLCLVAESLIMDVTSYNQMIITITLT